MTFSGFFQKIKWQFLAKKDPNYYIFSDASVSKDETKYRESGQRDVQKCILDDAELVKILEERKSKTCLEMGSGNGRMTEFLAKEFGRVIAVDISEEMLNLAKKRLVKYGNINYVQSDGSKLDVPDKTVDFVFSYIVLQHFPTKALVKKTLQEFHRVLKEKGIAKIQVRGCTAFGGIFRFFKWYYGVSFSGEEISKILKEADFKIIRSEGEGTKLFWLLLLKE